MHASFDAFVQAHRGLSRLDFLARVTAPHLVLRYLESPGVAPGDTFRTVKVQPAQAAAARGERLVLAVAKRPAANVFAMMITLGRAPNNDLVLADSRVSKLQAYFSHRGGTWHVWDPVSTNGTRVDGVPVPRSGSRPLRSMAVIELCGAAECLFVLPEDLYRLVAAPIDQGVALRA